jgi:hypothetical protein
MSTPSHDAFEARVMLSGGPGAQKSVVVRLSPHAAARYHERVRPALDAEAAARECLRLIPTAMLQTQPPVWLGPTRQRPAFYICIGDLAMPADPDFGSRDRLIVRTVLPRGMGVPSRRHRGRERRLTRAADWQASRDRRARLASRQLHRSRRRAARRSATLRNSRRWR